MFSNKLLAKIYNITSLNEQRLDTFVKRFDEHRHADKTLQANRENWQTNIMEKMVTCPESSRMQGKEAEQNGKINKLIEDVAFMRGTVKMWCYIFSAVIGGSAICSAIAVILK